MGTLVLEGTLSHIQIRTVLHLYSCHAALLDYTDLDCYVHNLRNGKGECRRSRARPVFCVLWQPR